MALPRLLVAAELELFPALNYFRACKSFQNYKVFSVISKFEDYALLATVH